MQTLSRHSYRCLITSGSSIQGVRTFECDSDADVILRASGFMKAHPEHPAIEIWEAKRFVARLNRNPLARGGLDTTLSN
jgi:hypothetical protein